MPRVADLVEEGKDAKLYHPVIGSVLWKEMEPGTGWVLMFAQGPEAGEPLWAEGSVLWDERWELVPRPI